MAESFLFSLAEGVLGKLSSAALQEIGQAWGVKKELKELEDTLSTIRAVLLDAEKQQGKNNELRVWMERLEVVCYDIDDVLDEFEIAALKKKVHGKVRIFFSRSNSLAFRISMGHKIKDIRERLGKISADKANFHLTEQYVNRSIIVQRDRETYSFLCTSDVIGRDQDKENIIDLLMQPNHHDNTISVIPIVGIAGLGKTTLAKMVFNDERVVTHFPLRIWVCVAEEFHLKKLIGKIIKSATKKNCDNLDMEELQGLLQEALVGKKFLLILDDVWSDDRVKWIEFSGFLKGGAYGSQIIVTTRSSKVASVMGTIPEAYNLEGLPHEDCLSLFVSWAFKDGKEREHPNLMKIGEEIVKKCKGVPLAVRTLGSLLYMKIDEGEWLFVRDNEIWKLEQKDDGILPALKLSYDQLPPHLKHCFAYCALFPKDYEFMTAGLSYLWIAEGFIQSPDQKQELEDIGKKYIQELWSRSFFQDVEDLGSILTFKMHDLVHDLALLIAKTECKNIDSHDQVIHKKVLHVSFFDQNLLREAIPSSLLELKNLRTILTIVEQVGLSSKSSIETIITRFKCLRVLDLRKSSFERLPSSIGRLKHLRFLNLSNNGCIKSLPNSICNLLCLQTLLLHGCVKLEKLPRDFGNLISLRCLTLTIQEKSLPKKAIGSLASLRALTTEGCGNLEFLFDDDDGTHLQWLTSLQSLMISDCERLLSLPQVLRCLTTLENLAIFNCKNLDLMMDEGKGDIQLGGGLISLRCFWIAELPKLVGLPQWLQGASNTLKHITIVDCPNFTTLPEWMENLKSLQKLWIGGSPQLTYLPDGVNGLPSLKEIRIAECPELTQRCQRETGENWRKIAHVPDIYLDCIKI